MRGTEITLHLKEDSLEYTDPFRLRSLAQHYSEFVIYPISLRTTHTIEVEDEEEVGDDDNNKKEETPKDADDELQVSEDEDAAEKTPKMKEVTSYEWERLNTNQAIWTRDKEEITDDEYQAFYHVSTPVFLFAPALSPHGMRSIRCRLTHCLPTAPGTRR